MSMCCPTCGIGVDEAKSLEILKSINTIHTQRSLIRYLVDIYPNSSDVEGIVANTYVSKVSIRIIVNRTRRFLEEYGWTIENENAKTMFMRGRYRLVRFDTSVVKD